jgi:hypothetical protein
MWLLSVYFTQFRPIHIEIYLNTLLDTHFRHCSLNVIIFSFPDFRIVDVLLYY